METTVKTRPPESISSGTRGGAAPLGGAPMAEPAGTEEKTGPAQDATTRAAPPPLRDLFGRSVRYLRLSVTDRCDLRCLYCMPERMTFLPRKDLLTLDELDRLCEAFIQLGVQKIRLTGGEPLVRKNILYLFERLARHLESGVLHELTLTSNGTHLAAVAQRLRDLGVRRINVSLDTRQADRFRRLTRWGELDKVLAGIEAARQAGLQVKINCVLLKDENESELSDFLRWGGELGLDLTFIETMPLGLTAATAGQNFLSAQTAYQSLARDWTLEPETASDLGGALGGPARYYRVLETGRKIGFITPMSHNFCQSCNRVRVTCTGTLYMCLGQNDKVELRDILRGASTHVPVQRAIRQGIFRKPRRHYFHTAAPEARMMNTTGG